MAERNFPDVSEGSPILRRHILPVQDDDPPILEQSDNSNSVESFAQSTVTSSSSYYSRESPTTEDEVTNMSFNSDSSAPPAVDQDVDRNGNNVQEDQISTAPTSVETVDEESSSASTTTESSASAGSVRKAEDGESERPSKMARLTDSSDQDGETCPICLEVWDNSGHHRLVALKCGHLFGHGCVERWLRAQALKDRSCPTCKTKATVRDMRFIYARKLIAADTAEMTRLENELESVKADKCRLEMELQRTRMEHRTCADQLEVLRRGSQPSTGAWRFSLDKNIEFSRDSGCRALAYNCRTHEIYVSQKSANALFPGFGIRKVSCVDYKVGQFVHLHPKVIRDLSYSQPLDLLLSAGLDGSARVVDRGAPVAIFRTASPLWTCAWDVEHEQQFYVGGVGGAILHYDLRKHDTPLQKLTCANDLSPVASLCSTQFGLMSCQLNSSWLWRRSGHELQPRLLPVEGPFLSLSYDERAHNALVACRPGFCYRARLNVCHLKFKDSEVVCEVQQTFSGSSRASVMSRAGFVRAGACSWVGAYSESDAELQLHGLDGARDISLPAGDPALDLCAPQVGGRTILASLSTNRLRVYKALTA